MVMATEEGATDRMHEGNLWLVLSVFDDDRVDSCVAFALPSSLLFSSSDASAPSSSSYYYYQIPHQNFQITLNHSSLSPRLVTTQTPKRVKIENQ